MHPNKIGGEGITFDDVLLVPAWSDVLPRDTDVSTRVTRRININIPILSAAMDTVTDSRMSIALAREGGLGILHKNMTIVAQAAEVDRVKRSESGIVRRPFTLAPTDTVKRAHELMTLHRISGFPVVSNDNKLTGIVTSRDMLFVSDTDIEISALMTPLDRLITVPEGTSLVDVEKILGRNRIEKLPVVAKDGTLTGLITIKDIQKRKEFPHAAKDEQGRLLAGAAVGISADTVERVMALVEAAVDVVIVDTAHGHSEGVIKMVQILRKEFPDLNIIAGNIGTADAASALIDAGVDAVKVGIGPGSICTTRVVAGVGVPQITAIMEVARVTQPAGIPLIADGGIKQTGDVAKAIAAGADTVMLGGLLAGHDESPGERILLEGGAYKIYRGMGSLGAMGQGSADRYFQDAEEELIKLVPEGIEGRVPYKGNVGDTIYQVVGGLRSAMGYCGCRSIAEMQNKATFIRMTASGLREAHPHDIVITKESPNYFTR